MSEGLIAKSGATPRADAAAGPTAPEAIVAPASSIGRSGAGEWQLNPTYIFSSRAGHALFLYLGKHKTQSVVCEKTRLEDGFTRHPLPM